MIIYRQTDLFDSDAQTLVNTVNCVGIMGKGIAKEFKIRDNEMFLAYKEICSDKLLQPGMLWLWRRKTPWVLNFPTKQHWRGSSKIEWIEKGLEKFVNTYEEKGISSISFPKLGCGNGGLEWLEVNQIMEYYLSQVDIKVYIHDFDGNFGLPEHLVAYDDNAILPTSLDDFYQSILLLVQDNPVGLTSLIGEESYLLGASDDGELTIQRGRSRCSLVGHDELRGVWLSLQRGTVFKREAEWFDDELGGIFIDILARLPYTKAFLVGKEARREIAVELARNSNDHTLTSDQESMFD